MTTEQTQANTQPKSKRVWNIVINSVLIAVVLFGVLCSYTAFVTKRGDGVPDLFGLRFFSIQSDSMEDEFYEGDLIVDVRIKDPAKLKVGDVITFQTNIQGEMVLNTHRIVAINQLGENLSFTTQGDNSPEEDSLDVHQSSLRGKYVFAIPKLGFVIDFLQTSVGFLCVIVLPVFLFFVYNLVQFFRIFFDYRVNKMKLQLKQEMLREQGLMPREEDANSTAPAPVAGDSEDGPTDA